MPVLQVPLWQSVETIHALPVLQAPQVPPQSLSVSVPFLTASKQVAPWQTPPAPQTLLVQSLPTEQV